MYLIVMIVWRMRSLVWTSVVKEESMRHSLSTVHCFRKELSCMSAICCISCYVCTNHVQVFSSRHKSCWRIVLCLCEQQAAKALWFLVIPPATVVCLLSLFLMDGFQWKLLQIFIMWLGFAEKIFMVGGQRSRSFLIIVCKLYYYYSYSYSVEGAITCVQMSEWMSEAYITTV